MSSFQKLSKEDPRLAATISRDCTSTDQSEFADFRRLAEEDPRLAATISRDFPSPEAIARTAAAIDAASSKVDEEADVAWRNRRARAMAKRAQSAKKDRELTWGAKSLLTAASVSHADAESSVQDSSA